MKSVHPWEREYRSPTFVTLDDTPQHCVRDFIKFLKKQQYFLDEKKLLDVGCGNGRNTIYAAARGAKAVGIDVSATAISLCMRAIPETLPKTSLQFRVHDIATPLPCADQSIDIVFDITTSHSLSPIDRQAYIHELHRVMKPGAWLLLRTLTRDGDSNAKKLLQQFPGSYPNMYRMPQTHMEEYVCTREELLQDVHGFEVHVIKKTSGYMTIAHTKYKRMYYTVYAQKI